MLSCKGALAELPFVVFLRKMGFDMKQVLFICIGNACRSPMAEGFANYYGKGWLIAHSAGVRPAGFVSPEAISVMAEKGIAISTIRSAGLATLDLAAMDWLVTMDASIIEAVQQLSRQIHRRNWIVPDPIGHSLDFYRTIRDQIELKVLELIEVIQKDE
jgi:arsenate reductase